MQQLRPLYRIVMRFSTLFDGYTGDENQFQGLAVDEIGGSRHPYNYGNRWELEFIGNVDIKFSEAFFQCDSHFIAKMSRDMPYC